MGASGQSGSGQTLIGSYRSTTKTGRNNNKGMLNQSLDEDIGYKNSSDKRGTYIGSKNNKSVLISGNQSIS